MSHQTVLEELTEDILTKNHIERRVEDWAERINTLYRQAESWLPAGWRAQRAGKVRMNEELMQTTGTMPRDLPILELRKDGQKTATFRPYGLWIVGTNGRMDLVRGNERYLIRDRANTFTPPDWRVTSAAARQDSVPFNETWLKNFLAK